MDQVAGELREPLEAKLAQQGMHSAAGSGGATIGGQNAAELEMLIERVPCQHPDPVVSLCTIVVQTV